MPYSPKPNRKRTRMAREIQASEGISYSAALRRVTESQSRSVYDLDAARELRHHIEEHDLSWEEVFRGDVRLSDRSLESVAALFYAEELEPASAEGLGLLGRAARLSGVPPLEVRMPADYPARVLKAARMHVVADGAVGAIADVLLAPESFDAPAEIEAAFMFQSHPVRFIAAAVIDWLAEDHPDRLATLAGISWRSRPAPLPSFWAGVRWLSSLDAIRSGGLVDAEALSEARRVLVEWITAESQ